MEFLLVIKDSALHFATINWDSGFRGNFKVHREEEPIGDEFYEILIYSLFAPFYLG